MAHKPRWDRESYVPIFCQKMLEYELLYSAMGSAHETSRAQLGRAYAVRHGDGWQCAYCRTQVRVVTSGQPAPNGLRSAP